MKKLSYLLSDIEYKCVQGNTDVDIKEVVFDSRKITKGCLFICIKGAKFDGHSKAYEAYEKKAAAIIVSEDVSLPSEITVIKVNDSRKAMAYVSASWFDHPASKLTTIGITGTKGKTTTSYMVKSILEKTGFKVGLVGTIEIITGSRTIKAVNTTPESYSLQEYFSEMVSNGVEVVVMEVSSQGLMMHRTDGFVFDYGIFTNLSPDHIGPNEHASFEEYRSCKGMLFKQCKVGIVNGDDDNCDEVILGHTSTIEKYGFKDSNDLVAKDVELINKEGYMGIKFNVSGLINMQVSAPVPGKFSVYNVLTTLAICRHFNVPNDICQEALNTVKVKGRCELIKVTDDIFFVVDYAHNALALESLLTSLREYKIKRMVTIFGCGGNKARDRRFTMGEVSGKYSDFTIITSDNPRDEEPLDIMKDIESGIKKAGINENDGKYVMIENRLEAIKYAVKNSQKGDVIVLAGKGHEDYQEIKGVKYHMDEIEMINSAINEFNECK